ncbi:hypothetical protein [Microbacterium sp. A1-JK]|uniref:hypothetical protein n=1 Tax=Microbacterium sp. A1-JK TaxID=3177516 RepID=UPI003886386A
MTAEEIAQIIQSLGPILIFLGVIASGIFTVRAARENRRSQQDQKPADTNEATKIANDLIFRLLDKANDEVKRYQGLVATVTAEAKNYQALADLVPDLQSGLDRAVGERDRLRKAIQFLEGKARITGNISYAEVVDWARLALDPEADIEAFDFRATETLPDGLEDTVTTQ